MYMMTDLIYIFSTVIIIAPLAPLINMLIGFVFPLQLTAMVDPGWGIWAPLVEEF